MRTRRNVIVLAVSLAAHLALLAAWFSARQDLRWAEPPTMEVALVTLAPEPKPQEAVPRVRSANARVLSRPAEVAEPRPIEQPPAPLPDEASPQIDPEWRVKPQPPLVLNRPGKSARKPPCKTAMDPSNSAGEPCPTGSAEEAIARYNDERDVANADFVAGGRQKRALKRYHELPGGAGFPGLRCTLLSRC